MLGRVKKHLGILQYLCKCPSKSCQFKALMKHADKDLVRCLCECIQNVTLGNVKIGRQRRKKLAKHKGVLRRILNRKTSVGRKRKLLGQTGGFLPLLLAPIIGLAGSLIGDAISGAIGNR